MGGREGEWAGSAQIGNALIASGGVAGGRIGVRIVLNGQQAFGKSVLEALLERGEEVIAVYCPEDTPDRAADPLKAAAVERGLPVHQPASFKTADAVDTLAALAPDLCVMAFVTSIVPAAFLDVPRLGTIQYHPSLLPRHRGPSAINWPIIQGETRTGLTIFWPDEGLDTGPILLQKEVDITPDDTLGSVYFDKLFPLGIAAMLDAVALVKDGGAPRIAQDDSAATYESWCRKGDVEIDWTRPVDEIHNLIRGADPQPGAWTTLDGKTVQFYDAARIAEAAGTPGEITAIGDGSIAIAAAGGQILVKRVRPDGGGKIGAAEFAADRNFGIGTRFTTRV